MSKRIFKRNPFTLKSFFRIAERIFSKLSLFVRVAFVDLLWIVIQKRFLLIGFCIATGSESSSEIQRFYSHRLLKFDEEFRNLAWLPLKIPSFWERKILMLISNPLLFAGKILGNFPCIWLIIKKIINWSDRGFLMPFYGCFCMILYASNTSKLQIKKI